MVNNEVPPETVRRLLDHSSHQMTARYGRLSDKSIREQWERNIAGEQLGSEPD